MRFRGKQNLNLNQFKNLVVHRGASFPTSYNVGQLFYRLDLDKLYVCITTINGNDNDWRDLTQRVSAGISGMIILWTGTLATIPTGYVLCDGNNGTVDLTDKFVKVSANSSDVVGQTGGSNTAHSHTGAGGGHTHTFTAYTGQGGYSSHHRNDAATGSDAFHGHTASVTTDSAVVGGTDSQTNIPAHIRAAYIMRI